MAKLTLERPEIEEQDNEDVSQQLLNLQTQMAAVDSTFALIELEADGTIVSANDNFLTMLGYSSVDLEGQQYKMLVHDEVENSQDFKQFWGNLSGGDSQSGEYALLHKDGSVVWVRARYNFIAGDGDLPAKVICLAVDITKDVAIRTDAQDLENRVEAISLAHAVIEFEPDGTIISANDNFLNAMGYSLDEIQGQKHRMFVDSETANSADYENFWRDLASGVSRDGEFCRVTKSGETIWLQARYSALKDENGATYKIVKYASDITDAVRIRKDAMQTHAIVESTPTNILLANKEGEIIYMNPASEKTLKTIESFLPTTVDKIVGSSYDIFHKDPGHQRKLLADPKNYPMETEFEIGGEWLHLVAAAMFDSNGEFTGPMIAWELVTEQKKAAQQEVEELQARVDQLLEVVNSASNGDLSREVIVSGDDAVAKLASGVRDMITDLRDIISQVIDGASQFTEGSRMVAESAQTLANGSQSQFASVEQMSASIEELTRSIDSVKENASEADQVARETNRLAEEGGAAVKQSVEAMERIKASSTQISEIIQVISEIASQTNLLALNAAIEAARAGEHGLGFAVVADEVRKLAERSSEAAKEISSLIKESTERVEEGAVLSEQTGESLTKIIQGVEGTAVRISEIAEATSEQSQNAIEVSNSIHQISEITEQSASGCEQLAASSEELGAQATSLRDLVSKFTLASS